MKNYTVYTRGEDLPMAVGLSWDDLGGIERVHVWEDFWHAEEGGGVFYVCIGREETEHGTLDEAFAVLAAEAAREVTP